MDFTFIVQARMGSTRLPGKILLPFYEGHSILELLIKKLFRIPNASVVVATSEKEADDRIAEVAGKMGALVYRGAENDVLERFIQAATFYRAQHIIRVCSDNPFLELASIGNLMERASENNVDYISFHIQGKPSIKTHYGFWTEYVTLDALKRVAEMTSQTIYHEHVTNYIYEHPQLFDIDWIKGPDILNGVNNIRLTIDTETDFENARKIYMDICMDDLYPTIEKVVSYLQQHPECFIIMDEQIKMNSK